MIFNRKQPRIPLRPRANITVSSDPKIQAIFDRELDEEFERRKLEYALKYGQAALEEELRKSS